MEEVDVRVTDTSVSRFTRGKVLHWHRVRETMQINGLT